MLFQEIRDTVVSPIGTDKKVTILEGTSAALPPAPPLAPPSILPVHYVVSYLYFQRGRSMADIIMVALVQVAVATF